ncbi:MAG: tellurite resistance TerB family protein [Paracoccus sp. (in: a-proteobacteria)]|uniref:tellurite resistance TerB family protein n=1 Tax=Paracoccus sp. TaxID=267 RepID=UPI0026E0E281|nr:tellurite resistance TerB family protein [Paracoccus sp. (in: a-proteobacteria)]MDO5622058.1 tellurite resistance TerB family protein [Paracoccus sp. (in: a-proteobacteria)]
MTIDLPPLSPCDALVAVMVAVSASDSEMRTAELIAIERIVNHTPVFAAYDIDRIRPVSQTVFTLFEDEDGLAALFGLVRDSLPRQLFDTAYVLACDVAAADGHLTDTEVEMLAEIRDELEIDRLHAAAIELAARARHRRLA